MVLMTHPHFEITHPHPIVIVMFTLKSTLPVPHRPISNLIVGRVAYIETSDFLHSPPLTGMESRDILGDS